MGEEFGEEEQEMRTFNRICAIFGGQKGDVKIFIPCYNYQNGYYSSNLSVVITQGGTTKTEVDISDCVEDHID
jgi:hypothetical protein